MLRGQRLAMHSWSCSCTLAFVPRAHGTAQAHSSLDTRQTTLSCVDCVPAPAHGEVIEKSGGVPQGILCDTMICTIC